jgi:hypothetical protein
VEACPGVRRHIRAPTVVTPSCLARSALATPIWLDGRH